MAVDPNFRTDGLGDAGPSSAVRSDDGDSLRFEFDARPLAAGESSLFLSLFTEQIDVGPDGTFRIEVRTADGTTVLSDSFPLSAP